MKRVVVESWFRNPFPFPKKSENWGEKSLKHFLFKYKDELENIQKQDRVENAQETMTEKRLRQDDNPTHEATGVAI